MPKETGASTGAAAKASVADRLTALAAKGEGKLIRHRSGVWSYPGCPVDTAATNLVYPIEFVSAEEVRETLSGDAFVVVMMDAMNEPVAIQVNDPAILIAPVSMARAGTADAGTELPPNSIPTRDAGSVREGTAEVEEATAKSLAALTPAKKRGA